MKSEGLIRAIGGIDDVIIERAEVYYIKHSRKARRMRLAAVSAAALILLTLAVFVIFHDRPAPAGQTERSGAVSAGSEGDGPLPASDPAADDIILSAADSGVKPSTGHRIALRCLPFSGDRSIELKVCMGQVIDSVDKAVEETDGYPVFDVSQYYFSVIETKYGSGFEKKEGGNVVINGVEEYEKRFPLETLECLKVSRQDDVFDGYSESVTLDFGNVLQGESGAIVFSYGVFYYSGNPYNQSEPDNSWCGKRIFLYYYCGENGISFSGSSAEKAFREYESHWPAPNSDTVDS